MTTDFAKTLRIGDRLSHDSGTEHVILKISDGVVTVSCNKCDHDHDWPLSGSWSAIGFKGRVTEHSKKTQVINQIRGLKPGAQILYDRMNDDNLKGTLVEVTPEKAAFLWDGDAKRCDWNFSEDLCWDRLTVLPPPQAPSSVPNQSEAVLFAYWREQAFKARSECLNHQNLISVLKKEREHDAKKLDFEKRESAAWAKRAEANAAVITDKNKKIERLELEAAGWLNEAHKQGAQAHHYRDQLLKIAEVLGPEKFIADDGSVQQDVLIAKIPELARAAILRPFQFAAKVAANPQDVTASPAVGHMIIDGTTERTRRDDDLLREIGVVSYDNVSDTNHYRVVMKDGSCWFVIIKR